MDLGLFQREAAALIGVSGETLRNWERGHRAPAKRYGPAIQAFMGSSPLPSAATLPDRLRVIRWTLGLTQDDLATRLGVNRCTVSAWEAGRESPNHANRQAVEVALMRALGEDGSWGSIDRESLVGRLK